MAYFLGGLGGGILIGLGFLYWAIIRHRKTPSLTKYVVFSVAVLIIYAIAEMVVSTVSGVSHDTLSTVFYACFGGEILSCALIKIFKLREENNNE